VGKDYEVNQVTWEEFSLRVRRRESPFYDRIYKLAKKLRSIEIPTIKPIFRFLYYERLARISIWQNFWKVFYYQPMFRARCEKVGKNLRLIGGIPEISGNLKVYLGDNVTLHGVSTFAACKVYDSPILRIGNNVHIGYQVGIAVGNEVLIGNNVLMGNRISIFGYDLHPVDPILRRNGESPAKEDIKPIMIQDDVWIGSNVTILKGVIIGEAVVVAAGSVVTEDVPPFVIVAGNPAKVVKIINVKKNSNE
jgi:acetyltransferase-like isoleucine patch superfamily enzyme